MVAGISPDMEIEIGAVMVNPDHRCQSQIRIPYTTSVKCDLRA